MDFKAIIKDGFINPISRKNIKDYFLRHYKIAEQNNYSINEFFDGCIEGVNNIEEQFNGYYLKRNKQLISSIEHNKDMLKNWKANKISSIPLTTQEFIDRQEYKLNTLKETFTVPLQDEKHGRMPLKHGDIEEMKNIILEVKSSLQPEKETKSLNIEPLDFNLNQTDIVHFFDLLVDADIINEPRHEAHKNTKGGFYGKLSQYFTAKGKSINEKSAKSIKPNKSNRGTSYSDSYFEMLNNLKKTIEDKLNK